MDTRLTILELERVLAKFGTTHTTWTENGRNYSSWEIRSKNAILRTGDEGAYLYYDSILKALKEVSIPTKVQKRCPETMPYKELTLEQIENSITEFFKTKE
jgi:topoisomerase IA-like protein